MMELINFLNNANHYDYIWAFTKKYSDTYLIRSSVGLGAQNIWGGNLSLWDRQRISQRYISIRCENKRADQEIRQTWRQIQLYTAICNLNILSWSTSCIKHSGYNWITKYLNKLFFHMQFTIDFLAWSADKKIIDK